MTDEPTVASDAAVQNLIEKADAGAQLFFAIYHMRKEKVQAVFKDASPGFCRAYMRASSAFLS